MRNGVLLLGVAVAATARADRVQLDAVKRAVARAESAMGALRQEVSDDAIRAAEAAGAACLKAVDAALGGGATAKTEVEVGPGLRTLPGARQAKAVTVAPLASVREHCAGVVSSGLVVNVRFAVDEADAAVEALARLQDPEQRQAQAAANEDKAKDCFSVVAQARAKLPASLVVESKRGKVPLKDARAHCQALVDTARKVADEARAATEAARTAFRTALTGDKLAIWETRFGLDNQAKGRGGVLLRTPEDYARASVWFATVTYDNEKCRYDGTGHRIVRYLFKGDTLKGKPTEKTGCGEDPPARAYR